ncbi:unnamed protein product [Bursaphelenchus okinawaensis]|uniref:Lipocalin domain-containing protein n=1 Tax=Bursaphelenchus okinawaensis TaxID=465554 RepID=A0A811JRW2_9BILA|nr:unnamed protein product [Bursaphelenchus okinawaensis]CAG9079762.1 unnamed protein product [Bursaphelenchus okinawaensis]
MKFHAILLLFTWVCNVEAVKFYGGIPVPGRRVPALRYFEYYLDSCSKPNDKNNAFDELNMLLRRLGTEEIAEKTLNNMYFAVDDIDIKQLMGRWLTVVDSPFVHKQYCAVNYYKLNEESKYTANFVTQQTSRNSEQVVTYEGFGNKVGPDPGSVFIHTGNPADPCPFIPVKVGPVNKPYNQFEYVIMTTPLKTPTVVLARDATVFKKKYRPEVEDYLTRFNYMNPVSLLNQPLHFLNVSNCNTYQHFDYDLGLDD